MRPSGQPRPSDAHLPTAESLGPAAAQQIEQLARVFEAAPIGMAVWSIDGELLHANPVFGDLVGEATSELIGRRFEDFIESADAPDVRQLIEQVWLGERNAFECELRARRPDGVEQFVRAHIAPVYGSEGEPAYLISQVFDFTSSRLARDAPARLAADAPALLWLADETGALRAANRALVDFIGATASGELGPSPLLSPDHPDEQLARVRDRMRQGGHAACDGTRGAP